jgi:hypothetical protein
MTVSDAETAKAKNRQPAIKTRFMSAQFARTERGIQTDSILFVAAGATRLIIFDLRYAIYAVCADRGMIRKS